MDNKSPSKLQGTINLPDLIPSIAFFATSSAFMAGEESAMIVVSFGFLLFSAISKTLSRIEKILQHNEKDKIK